MAHSHSHHSHHFHSHDHSHDDDNNNNTCGLEMTENPSSLSPEGFPSIQDLLSGKPHDVLRAFTTLLRFGRFEAMQPLVEGLLLQQQQQDSEGNNTASSDTSTTTTTTTTLKALLQDHDEGGHSLLHWAAKRGDDLRFLQTLIELVLELDLKSIINIPRYVPKRTNYRVVVLYGSVTEWDTRNSPNPFVVEYY
jgi:ankyrin repeat protein